MAYSVQICKAYLTKDPKQIATILEDAKERNATSHVEITKVNHVTDENLVRASLNVTLSTGIYYCDVTINQPRNLLLIQAPRPTRSKIKAFLANVIEQQNFRNIIHDHNLKLRQSKELFDSIAAENEGNIIEILTIHFEPEYGYKYEKETYTEMSYKFIQNRCATKHRDFQELAKNGKRMTMKLILLGCRNLVRGDKIALVVKPDSSFRAYTDIQQEVWDDFCFNVGYVDD